jgi:hypothetical protein
MDDLRSMPKSQRGKRSEKSGKSRKHQRDLQFGRPQPFNQGKPPLESPPPGGKERRLIGSRWDLHEAAAVTILANASGISATSMRCRVSGSRTRPASQATHPKYSAIALGGVPIKKIRYTKGELAGNKIPFLLRPMARKNRETAFVLAWGKATPSPEAVDNVDSRKRTCSRRISESKTARCFHTMGSNAFRHSSKVEASKSRRVHAGSITASKSFAVTNNVYSGNGAAARPFSAAE